MLCSNQISFLGGASWKFSDKNTPPPLCFLVLFRLRVACTVLWLNDKYKVHYVNIFWTSIQKSSHTERFFFLVWIGFCLFIYFLQFVFCHSFSFSHYPWCLIWSIAMKNRRAFQSVLAPATISSTRMQLRPAPCTDFNPSTVVHLCLVSNVKCSCKENKEKNPRMKKLNPSTHCLDQGFCNWRPINDW